MNNPRHIIVAAFVIGSVLGLTRVGGAVTIQPTASPDSVDVTIDQIEIAKNDVDDYRPLLTASAMRTFDASSNNEIGRGDVPVGEYRALRVTLTGMSWSVASWGTTNRSPCTDVTVGTGTGPVDLGGHTLFYFKTPDLGGNTLAYYRAHPPLTGYVGDADHPFVLASPITVLKDRPTTVNLTLDVDQALACNSLSLFTLAGGGPVATIAGSKTGLTGVGGVYVNSYLEEIGVANGGNNSVTRYSQVASGDVAPDTGRTLIGPATLLNEPTGVALLTNQADHTKDVLFVANRGNNTIAVFYTSSSGNSPPLRSISGDFNTGLDIPEGVAVDAANGELIVANSGADSGNGSVTFYDLAASGDVPPLLTISGAGTGLSQPSGVALHPDSGGDPTKTAVVVANHGNNTVTIYDRTGLLTKTLAGVDTQLNGPAGVAVYSDPNNSNNDEIIVANEGSGPGTGTMTIYNWNAVMSSPDGNEPPATTVSGLNTPTGLYLDTVQNQIGVVQGGDQVAMVSQPPIVPVGSNLAGSSSALLGDYNVVVYGVDLKAVNRRGYVIPVVVSERGRANFDGSGGFSLRPDAQLGRQVLELDCLTDQDAGVGITKTGYYGVNDDGGFYALLPGTGGSFQGAFSPNGNVFVGSIYDSSDHLRLIYGVRTASSIPYPYLTSDGTSVGLSAYYGFANYRNDLFKVGRFDDNVNSKDTLRYLVGVGMAKTDSSSVIGVSSDANFVEVLNPVGEAANAGSGGPIYRTGFSLLEQSTQLYDNSNPGEGVIINPSDGLTGALTRDGATLIFARDNTTQDTNGCPTDIGFGMGLRQRPAGTFSASSIKGTYFVAAFGDRYDVGMQRSLHRVTALSLTFDGKGNVQMAEIVDQDGMISVDNASLTYKVNSRVVPEDGGTSFRVDVVDLFDRHAVGPYASALIGEDGKSLIFFRALNLVQSPNRIRLLGLGLFQHS